MVAKNALEDVQYLRALDCMSVEDYEGALLHFSKAVFLHPNDAEIHMQRARCYLAIYDTESAVNSGSHAVRLLRQQSEYARADAAEQWCAAVLDEQGTQHVQVGLHKRAENLFTTALEMVEQSCGSSYPQPGQEDEEGEGGLPLEAARVIFHRGLSRYQQHMWEDVRSDLLQCANTPKLRPYPCVMLALLSLRQKDYKGAKGFIEVGLVGYSNNLALQNVQAAYRGVFDSSRSRAIQLIDEGKYDDAKFTLEEMLAAGVQDAELYRLRSTCLSAVGKYTDAVKDLFESIQCAGGSDLRSAQQLSCTLVAIGDDLVAQGKEAQALQYYTEAIKWDATVPDWFLRRGDCSHRLARNEDALLDYKHVLELDSLNEHAWIRLATLHDEWGIVLFNRGDYERAETEFTQALKYKPDIDIFLYHRSQCRMMMHNETGAIEDLQKCGKIGSTDPKIVAAVEQFCSTSKLKQPTVVRDGEGAPLFVVIPDPPPKTKTALIPPKNRAAVLGAPRPRARTGVTTRVVGLGGEAIGGPMPWTARNDSDEVEMLRTSKSKMFYDPYGVDAVRATTEQILSGQRAQHEHRVWDSVKKGKKHVDTLAYDHKLSLTREAKQKKAVREAAEAARIAAMSPSGSVASGMTGLSALRTQSALGESARPTAKEIRFGKPLLTVRELRQLRAPKSAPTGGGEGNRDATQTTS